jgi:hypothetical protein
MADNQKPSSKYVFGVRGMDMMFERMYKKHGSTMNRMFKGKNLSPDKAFSVLQYIDNNPDMSYVEIKNKLLPPKKQELVYGGTVHRGRTANGNKD